MSKCVDCGNELDISSLTENEVIVCSQCGAEYEFSTGRIRILVLKDGEDWGE